MPDDWTPTEAPIEPLSFGDAVAINGQTRRVERTARAGQPNPEHPGELVPEGQTRTTFDDLGVIHAQGLVAIARGEAHPAPPVSQETTISPYQVSAAELAAAQAVLAADDASDVAKAAAQLTVDQGQRERQNFANAAMRMAPGIFTGAPARATGGQVDARAVGARGQQPQADDDGGIY